MFQVTGRLVVMSDTLYDDFDTRTWRHGSTVELRRPDGSSFKTKAWYEMGSTFGKPMAFSVDCSRKKTSQKEQKFGCPQMKLNEGCLDGHDLFALFRFTIDQASVSVQLSFELCSVPAGELAMVIGFHPFKLLVNSIAVVIEPASLATA